MNAQSVSPFTRSDWFHYLFPGGVPPLWCPPLTHYDGSGEIDAIRTRAHLAFLSPWIKGLLVPGSTGDAWELSQVQTERLLDLVLETVSALGQRVLIGALRPESAEAQRIIAATTARLPSRLPDELVHAWLLRAGVCGFAICPPRGEMLTQEDMSTSIRSILKLDLPTALYQLPQVTRNEMGPLLVQELAERFPNFILFKDTSGKDTVATSGADLKGVFLVRGMEGDYARWLKPAKGPYDGFLLSAANSFARELSEIVKSVQVGRFDEARALSGRISQVVREVFALVQSQPDGNLFSNGGKAIDHYFAQGPRAASAPPPYVHSGRTLPTEVIRATGESLTRSGLMPSRGYLE